MKSDSTGKRLVKNTAYMYVRMILLTLISLYTSRVVLQQLGVDDFGIYSVVGSVVAMFSSLRGLFATSTQRFINYEMGQGRNDKVNTIFNMSILIQFIISAILLLTGEGVGVWFIEYRMSIEPSRIVAAHWTLQFSLISVIVSMITTPFDALVIAHEKMSFYAYVAIIEAILRLAIVFALDFSSFDKLIFYAALQLLITFVIFFVNLAYCKSHFMECRFVRTWDKGVFVEMSAFAGWNFLGNTAFAITQNGLNMLLNTFCGVTVNAARAVAYQANAALAKSIDAVTTVVNPYCTKTYASGLLDKTLDMIYISSKIYLILQIVIAMPLCVFGTEILQIWLGIVPNYTTEFMKLVMLHSVIRSIHYPINNLFKTVGKLKRYQIAEGIILSFPLLTSFIFLRIGYQPHIVFWMLILFEIINYFAIIKIAQKDAFLPLGAYVKRVICPCIIILVIALVAYLICTIYNTVMYRTLLLIFSVLFISCSMYIIGFNRNEKLLMVSVIKSLLGK